MAAMNFSLALRAAMGGERITRGGWNGQGQYVFFAREGIRARLRFCPRVDQMVARDVELEPFLILRNSQGKFFPWTPSQGDMQASDWIVLDQREPLL